jgi:hypothetical protein
VSMLANTRCRPLGNLSRLPFGRSISDQDVRNMLPMAWQSLPLGYECALYRISLSADAFP